MKKAIILLAEGFEEIEALTVVDVLRRADVVCDMVALGDTEVTGSHGIVVKCDRSILDGELNQYDGIILPGGQPGSDNLREDVRVIELVKDYFATGKLVAAICAAPIVLAKAGILSGRASTCYPGYEGQLDHNNAILKEDLVVIDENIITSRGPATALEFSYEILKYFEENEKAASLREGMLYNKLF